MVALTNVSLRVIFFTTLAMVAFAANSILCRMALKETGIDAASFTSIRLLSGAVVLGLIVLARRQQSWRSGNWPSAAALFVYAAGFSFAYVSLSTATGALLLFGAVQATMIAAGFWSGERLLPVQLCGVLLALAGLVGLLLPGFSAPPLGSALLMLSAGVAWGVYSLRGKTGGDPSCVSAGNFSRAALMSAALSIFLLEFSDLNLAGVFYAVASGALASGLGYALWYSVLPQLKSITSAVVQLSVPVIAAFAGLIFLQEAITLRMVIAGLAILGGIALVIVAKK